MIANTVKNNWDRVWDKGTIHFFPEENSELILKEGEFPLKIGYVPERAKRFISGAAQGLPLGANILEREDCLYRFDRLVLLANNRPITRYHSILCSIEHIPQNDFTHSEIYEVSKIVEDTEIRCFLNLTGTAATLNHFHTQILFDSFNIEVLPKYYLTKNLGFLCDYPGGNILFTGTLDERCLLLFEKIEELTKSKLTPTIRSDGSLSEFPLYTLLFWDNNILLVPRKRETPCSIKAMAGGLELSGYFLITAPVSPDNTFEGFSHEKMLSAIKEVTFDRKDLEFLY